MSVVKSDGSMLSTELSRLLLSGFAKTVSICFGYEIDGASIEIEFDGIAPVAAGVLVEDHPDITRMERARRPVITFPCLTCNQIDFDIREESKNGRGRQSLVLFFGFRPHSANGFESGRHINGRRTKYGASREWARTVGKRN